MTDFFNFSQHNKILSVFETSKKQALIIDYKHPYLANYRLVIIANQKTVKNSKSFIVHKDVIAGAKSYSGLVKAIKDDSLHQSIHDLYQSHLDSVEQDSTTTVEIVKDKAPAKVECKSPLSSLTFSRPSVHSLSGAGFFAPCRLIHLGATLFNSSL